MSSRVDPIVSRDAGKLNSRFTAALHLSVLHCLFSIFIFF
jgi:hypothetical protein